MTALAGLAAGTWAVDAAATRVVFRARDVLRRTVVGTLALRSAEVEVSPAGVPCAVRADLDLCSVATGSTRRDEDLRGPRFLDVQRDPLLRVTTGPAEPDGSGRWLLPAQLALRGTTCRIELAVALVELTDGRARVTATATLDRRSAGITVPRLLVGTAVAVEVDAVLRAPARVRV